MNDEKLNIQLSSVKLHPFDTIQGVALTTFNKIALPSTKNEEWIYTSLRGLWGIDFTQTSERADLGQPNVRVLPEAPNHRVVFVDGRFSPELSVIKHLPDGVEVVPFSNSSGKDQLLIDTYLNRIQNFETDYFALLNTAAFIDGALVYVPKNVVLEDTIHLVYMTSSEGPGNLVVPRTLIIGETHAKFKVIEEYVSDTDRMYLNVPLTEVILKDGAHLTHVRIQNDSRSSYHINRTISELSRNADLQSYTISLGSRLFRNDVRAVLNGEAAHATLDGLVLVNENQLSDTHSVLDHKMPNCTSHQLHKCIVDGVGTSIFNGKIFVRRDAQQTNAFQENHNMQLSHHGMVYTKPQLEIFADDVKCSHGATVGQLNDDQMFYLKSRGLNDIATKELLTFGFATEVIDTIPVESVRDELRSFVQYFTQKSFETAIPAV